jgi:hypothetical protein
MCPEERAELEAFEEFFKDERLQEIPRSDEDGVLDLTDDDVQQLINEGLLEQLREDGSTWDISRGLAMRIFCTPEVLKMRRRLIIHTVDINNYYDTPPTSFTSLDLSINENMKGFTWSADAKAYYHQFALEETAKKYYTFFSPSFGWLRLATIPTGQRHCVGLAQLVSKFIMRVTQVKAEATLGRALQWTSECYIDNFRGTHTTRSEAVVVSKCFVDVCNSYNLTLNETEKTLTENIGKPHTFRGVSYCPSERLPGYTADISHKIRCKLHQAKIELLSENISMALTESIFSLCVYASSIKKIFMAPYYYVFKFFRRRQQQMSAGKLGREAPAKIWPTVIPLFQAWIEAIDESAPRTTAKEVPEQTAILYTDASLWGWGAVFFSPDGRVTSTGAPWEANLAKRANIAELEAIAVFRGLAALATPGEPTEVRIDNTTVRSALEKTRSRSFLVNAVITRSEDLLKRFWIAKLVFVKSEDNLADGRSRGEAYEATRRQRQADSGLEAGEAKPESES